jgi:hypothetical protein
MALLRWRKHELRERFYPPRFRGMYDRFSDVIHDYVRKDDVMLDAGDQARTQRVVEGVLEHAAAAASGIEHDVALAHVVMDDVGESVVHAAELRRVEAFAQFVLSPAKERHRLRPDVDERCGERHQHERGEREEHARRRQVMLDATLEDQRARGLRERAAEGVRAARCAERVAERGRVTEIGERLLDRGLALDAIELEFADVVADVGAQLVAGGLLFG